MRTAQGIVVSSPHPFRRVPRWLWAAFAGLVVGWSGWYLTTNYRDAVAQHVADAKVWTITGPPCPASTKAQYLGRYRKGPRRVDFEGVTLFRRFGHTECAVIRDKAGRGHRRFVVCQFTSPGDLLVRAGGSECTSRPDPVSRPRSRWPTGGQPA